MAVFTPVPRDDLNAFVADYDFGDVLNFSEIAEGAENSNFLLQTTSGSFILTIFERRVNPDDLPFFLGLMDHLANTGIPCPVPIKDKDGRALKTLCDKPAAIVSFLNGEWPKHITSEHCTELGLMLATLHDAGLTYDQHRANDLSLNAWIALRKNIGRSADSVESGLDEELDRALESIGAAWPEPSSDLPRGLIHADLFPDNVFFTDGQCSGLIDFYFACSDVLVYDIAICLNAWCFENDGTFNASHARSMVRGYESVRALTHQEKSTMPIVLQGACVRFLLTRLYDSINTPPDANMQPKDPREYLHKLRFHQSNDNLSIYGLS